MEVSVSVVLGAFAAGVVFGIFASLLLRKVLSKDITKTVRDSFAAVAIDTMSKSSEQLVKLAEQKFSAQTERHVTELEGKKQLIDSKLEEVGKRLQEISDLVHGSDQQRNLQYGKLEQQLIELSRATNQLGSVLNDNRQRGQWGEMIAEAVLRIAGFVEGINYRKQQMIENTQKRPDFTFLLPNKLSVNMDCKFPLNNYIKFLEATNDTDRDYHKRNFLQDVRKQIKDVKTREYINPDQSTIDCVLLFIPNESLLRFIHEEDQALIKEALESKVILCSPLSLLVILSIINQATQNFVMQKSSREILGLLNEFKKEWNKYIEELEKINKAINNMREAYDNLTGVRKSKLEKQINRIDELKNKYNIEESELLPAPSDDDTESRQKQHSY